MFPYTSVKLSVIFSPTVQLKSFSINCGPPLVRKRLHPSNDSVSQSCSCFSPSYEMCNSIFVLCRVRMGQGRRPLMTWFLTSRDHHLQMYVLRHDILLRMDSPCYEYKHTNIQTYNVIHTLIHYKLVCIYATLRYLLTSTSQFSHPEKCAYSEWLGSCIRVACLVTRLPAKDEALFGV